MDPLTAIGTTVGLAVGCVQMVTAIKSGLSRFEDAPQILQTIHQAVEPVFGSLEELQKFIPSSGNTALEPSLQGWISAAVSGCESTLSQLKQELDQLAPTGGNQFRLRFRLLSGKEAKINQLLSRLESNKSTLFLLLQTLTA
jgi:hypothetical protein